MNKVYVVRRDYEEGDFAFFSSRPLAEAWVSQSVANFAAWVANPESCLEPEDVESYRSAWYIAEESLDGALPESWEVENY